MNNCVRAQMNLNKTFATESHESWMALGIDWLKGVELKFSGARST